MKSISDILRGHAETADRERDPILAARFRKTALTIEQSGLAAAEAELKRDAANADPTKSAAATRVHSWVRFYEDH